MASTDMFSAFLERERFQKTTRDNSAKLAIYSDEVTTTGWGEVDLEDCIVFDSTFIERPTVSYGCSIVDEDEAELARVERADPLDGFEQIDGPEEQVVKVERAILEDIHLAAGKDAETAAFAGDVVVERADGFDLLLQSRGVESVCLEG